MTTASESGDTTVEVGRHPLPNPGLGDIWALGITLFTIVCLVGAGFGMPFWWWGGCLPVLGVVLLVATYRRRHAVPVLITVDDRKMLTRIGADTVGRIDLRDAAAFRLRRNWRGTPLYLAVRAEAPASPWRVISVADKLDGVWNALKARKPDAEFTEVRENPYLAWTSYLFFGAAIPTLLPPVRALLPDIGKRPGAVCLYALLSVAALVPMLDCGGEARRHPGKRAWKHDSLLMYWCIGMLVLEITRQQ